jgi:hypothetical protein
VTARALAALLLLWAAAAEAQVSRPQSPAGLTVTFTTERMGGSRVLVFGEVRNATTRASEDVVVLAEGLDEGGRVVSRGRAYVQGQVPPGGTAPFEIRLLASGAERRYRVQVETFQFGAGPGRVESP